MATLAGAGRKLERIEAFFCDIEKEETPQASGEIKKNASEAAVSTRGVLDSSHYSHITHLP